MNPSEPKCVQVNSNSECIQVNSSESKYIQMNPPPPPILLSSFSLLSFLSLSLSLSLFIYIYIYKCAQTIFTASARICLLLQCDEVSLPQCSRRQTSPYMHEEETNSHMQCPHRRPHDLSFLNLFFVATLLVAHFLPAVCLALAFRIVASVFMTWSNVSLVEVKVRCSRIAGRGTPDSPTALSIGQSTATISEVGYALPDALRPSALVFNRPAKSGLFPCRLKRSGTVRNL